MKQGYPCDVVFESHVIGIPGNQYPVHTVAEFDHGTLLVNTIISSLRVFVINFIRDIFRGREHMHQGITKLYRCSTTRESNLRATVFCHLLDQISQLLVCILELLAGFVAGMHHALDCHFLRQRF